MTRATKVRKARRAQPTHNPRRGIPRELALIALFGLAAMIVAGVLIWRAGGNDKDVFSGIATTDPGPIHVHGLGVKADGTLYVATHTGLFQVAQGERKVRRIGDRFQDTMGFTIVGANRFLGSGHPDINEAREQGLPPLLGLIESTDAGETWQPISLSGQADFHILRFVGERVYGYDASNDRLLISDDRGRSWSELQRPGPLVDLAVDPSDATRIVAVSAGGVHNGLFESRNGGKAWQRLSDAVGLLAWPERQRLYLVAGGGQVFVSRNGGRQLEHRGEIGGEPAALLAKNGAELYVALHGGTIKRSADGGATWKVRSTP